MLNYYQPFTFPFLGRKQYVLPKGISQHYFHSFEDGLWDILKQKKIPRGSVLLLPDFYCIDVIKNIEHHGFQIQFYSLNSQFQASEEDIISLIQEVNPQVVIIFHVCGVLNTLVQSELFWEYASNILVIEDSVHLLINPEEVSIKNNNHFIIDSLRKVSPLPGSFVYSLPGVLTRKNQFPFTAYTLSTHVLFLLFKALFVFGVLFHSTRLVRFAHEKVLNAHDAIVGDVFAGTHGFPPFVWAHRFFNFEKVKKIKKAQVELYNNILSEINQFSAPLVKSGQLHAYPLVISRLPETAFEHFLHTKKAVVWFKYPDCLWSKKRSVLFLPLGFHVSDAEIKNVSNNIKSYVSSDGISFHE